MRLIRVFFFFDQLRIAHYTHVTLSPTAKRGYNKICEFQAMIHQFPTITPTHHDHNPGTIHLHQAPFHLIRQICLNVNFE